MPSLDEATDALLTRMPKGEAAELRRLLTHREGMTGGAMTTLLVTARRDATVADMRGRLAEQAEHRTEIDAVAVVDDEGRVLCDIPLFDLAVAEDTAPVADLAAWRAQFGPPVTVHADTPLSDAADQPVAARASSLLVLTNRRSVLGPAAKGPRYRIAATAVVVGVGGMSTVLLVQTVLGWFGLA